MPIGTRRLRRLGSPRGCVLDASRGRGRGVLSSALILAGPAATLAASPPFPFQGADGDQVDGPLIDWQGMQAAQRVTHPPDPTTWTRSSRAARRTTRAGGGSRRARRRRRTHPRRVVVVDQPGGLTSFTSRSRARHRGRRQHHVRSQPRRKAVGQRRPSGLRPYRAGARRLLVTFEPHKGLDFILNRWITDEVDDASNWENGPLRPDRRRDRRRRAGGGERRPDRQPPAGFYSDLVPPKIPTERFGEAL